jgi:protein SHQ1
LRTSYRRALAFPLYRSFALCQRVQKDVAQLLGQGTRAVIRRLLATKKILDSHDVYYLYSKIWIDDFCAWLASYSTDADLEALGSELTATRLSKAEIGWDLEELEQAVRETEPDSDDEDVDVDEV